MQVSILTQIWAQSGILHVLCTTNYRQCAWEHYQSNNITYSFAKRVCLDGLVINQPRYTCSLKHIRGMFCTNTCTLSTNITSCFIHSACFSCFLRPPQLLHTPWLHPFVIMHTQYKVYNKYKGCAYHQSGFHTEPWERGDFSPPNFSSPPTPPPSPRIIWPRKLIFLNIFNKKCPSL